MGCTLLETLPAERSTDKSCAVLGDDAAAEVMCSHEEPGTYCNIEDWCTPYLKYPGLGGSSGVRGANVLCTCQKYWAKSALETVFLHIGTK